MTSRGPLTLAALASAAVPGLDPSSVEGVVPSGPAQPFDVAFVQDHEHRRWVVRCPRTPAASARLEQSAALLTLLSRRLSMPVPSVKGWVALPEGGRACVHSYLTGRVVDLASIAPGSTLAAGLGRALAQLHNLDRRIYEEAGVPVYEAEAYRTRRLAELDRAAATGRVPTGLLTRWEHTLEDLSLWRFTTTPTHGDIGASSVLATPDDGEDPDVKALLGWESAQVADPADDLAALVDQLHPDALDTVLEAYAHARADRPDRHLQERARLVHQMQLVRTMMSAVAAGDDDGAEDLARSLRRLDDRLSREEDEKAAAAAASSAASADGTDEGTSEGTSGRALVEDPEVGDAPDDTVSDGSGSQDTGRSSEQPRPDSEDTPTDSAPEGASGQPDDAAIEDAAADDAVVETEDTGAPTPVAPADTTAVALDEHTPPPTGAPHGKVRVRADSGSSAAEDLTVPTDEEAVTEHASLDEAATPSTTPAADTHRRPSRDHETAEIVALTGDDGDDVIPPSGR